MLKEDIALLDAVEAKIGVSRYTAAVKAKSRRRLEVDVEKRQKRVTFKWSLYKRKYERQAGICPLCKDPMRMIRGAIEMDHVNPNAQDFNAEYNLQVVHKGCNRSKGGMSLAEQSKKFGRTTVELLSGGGIDEDP